MQTDRINGIRPKPGSRRHSSTSAGNGHDVICDVICGFPTLLGRVLLALDCWSPIYFFFSGLNGLACSLVKLGRDRILHIWNQINMFLFCQYLQANNLIDQELHKCEFTGKNR